MMTIATTDQGKGVTFMKNGGREDEILVFAEMRIDDRWEYWFSIGKFYKTLKAAKRSAVKKMAEMGYTFDEKVINEAQFND